MKKNAVRSTAIAEATSPRLFLQQCSRPLMMFVVMLIFLSTMPIPVWSAGSGHRWGNSSLKFSPDGRSIAFAYGAWTKIRPIRLIDLETKAIIITFPVESTVSDLSFSPNGDLLAASITLANEPSDGVIRVWNIQTVEEISHTDTRAVRQIRFLEDNKTVAYDTEIWNIEDGTTKETGQRLWEVDHSVDFPRLSSSGFREKGIYVTADRKEAAPLVVKIAKTDEIIEQLPVDGTVQSLFFDYSGETLAVLVQNGKIPIQLWDTNSWTLRQSFYTESSPIEGTFSRDGKLLAVHFEDETLRIWDLITQEEKKPIHLLMPAEELLEAAENGQSARLQELISDGVDIEAREVRRGRTAIMLAAENGHSEVIRLLFESRADANARDSDGRTATILAAMKGHPEVIQLLSESGADMNARDSHGWTAMMRAADWGHFEVVKLLLSIGAQKADVLPIAAWTGNVEMVRILIDANADLDRALVSAKNREIAEILISAGADVNSAAVGGPRALIVHSSAGRNDVVALLLKAGADVNIRDETRSFGSTALSAAAHSRHKETVRMLIEAGADVNARNNEGRTALMYASWSTGRINEEVQIEIVQMLIDAGADVKLKDDDGKTALNYAEVGRNRPNLVELLRRAAEK